MSELKSENVLPLKHSPLEESIECFKDTKQDLTHVTFASDNFKKTEDLELMEKQEGLKADIAEDEGDILSRKVSKQDNLRDLSILQCRFCSFSAPCQKVLVIT